MKNKNTFIYLPTQQLIMNVAVIGTGTWGVHYARIANETPGIILKYVCDTDKEKGMRIARMYNTLFVKDYKAIIEDPYIEAVIIATPLEFHYSITKECLIKGKHVLVEKPICKNVDEAEKLLTLAREKELVLMVGHVMRFSPPITKLKELVKKGEFGNIRFMYANRMGLMTPRSDCGVIYDFAVHDFDIMNYIIKGMPIQITATGMSYIGNGQFEDAAFVNLVYPNKVIANVSVSWLTPVKSREFWLIGDKKSAKVDAVANTLTIYNKTIVPSADSFGSFNLLTKIGGAHMPYIPNTEPLKLEVMHFMECVNKNKRPLTDIAIARNAIKIADAAVRSIKENKSIFLS